MSITLLDNNPSRSDLTKEFHSRLSKRPYCSDNLEFGLQIRNKQVALSKKYIQANTPFNLSWLCFDIDYPCVLETTFKEKILPSPNIIVVNPKNHHSHLLYGIKQQVHLTDNSSIEPIRYAHAIQYALREELKADSGYTGLIIKNPQNDEWHTKELTESLWSLGELAEYLKLPNKIPKKEMFIGLGRNCTLFENARYFAYSEVLKYKITANKDIEDIQREIIFTMGTIGESRSKETGNHVKRVAEYSYLLAKLSGLNEDESELLKQASPMHDIGKVAIPDSILHKTDKLTKLELEIMKTHALKGYELLKGSDRPLLKMAAIIALEHHEKWNGEGYPTGLKEEEISIYGRITAICDVFDALGSDRCYKKAWIDEEIFAFLKEEKGKHFDPKLVEIFFENLEEFIFIRNKYKDTF
jgi:HD-GYP domain-containing protein (c-di-GMP phosphodiesterase class II)